MLAGFSASSPEEKFFTLTCMHAYVCVYIVCVPAYLCIYLMPYLRRTYGFVNARIPYIMYRHDIYIYIYIYAFLFAHVCQCMSMCLTQTYAPYWMYLDVSWCILMCHCMIV